MTDAFLPAENHPSTVISGAPAQSQKQHGSFASVLKNSCPSGSDPIFPLTVTPAKAGAQKHFVQRVPLWVPAFAGMTPGGNFPTGGRRRKA
jgi:hypothetical protein